MSNIAKSILGPRLPTDGFDPDVPYQFVELRRERPMGVRTFDFKSLIEISNPAICRMSNFKLVRQTVPDISPVPFPGPGALVSRMALPAHSHVTFSLHGRAEGRTFLKGRDQRDDAEVMPGAKYALEISVHSGGSASGLRPATSSTASTRTPAAASISGPCSGRSAKHSSRRRR